MTLQRTGHRGIPGRGEINVVNIGPLTCENGAVVDDVSIAVQRW